MAKHTWSILKCKMNELLTIHVKMSDVSQELKMVIIILTGSTANRFDICMRDLEEGFGMSKCVTQHTWSTLMIIPERYTLFKISIELGYMNIEQS